MRLCHVAWIRKCPPHTHLFGFSFLMWFYNKYFEECINRERGALSMYALNIVKRREKHVQPLALQTPRLITWELALQSRLSLSDSPALDFTEYYLTWVSSYRSFTGLKAPGWGNTAHFIWRQRCKERLEKKKSFSSLNALLLQQPY